MTGEDSELTVRELLEKTYLELVDRHEAEEIVLPDNACAVIANDSDFHSNSDIKRMHKRQQGRSKKRRCGYVRYSNAGLFEFGGGLWAVAKGESCGGYVSEGFEGDIIAVEIEQASGGSEEELTEKIWKESNFFRNSLVTGMYNGKLFLNDHEYKGKYGRDMFELLDGRMLKLAVERDEEDVSHQMISESKYFPLVLMHNHERIRCRPKYKNPVRYRPEAVDLLVDSVDEVLKQNS